MKLVFDSILARVQRMTDAEFSAEIARYREDEVVKALSQMEEVLADGVEDSWVSRILSTVWSIPSKHDSVRRRAVDDFEDCVVCNAANDERFALAA